MKLFHGSHVVVDNPQVRFGRDKVDFGKGFYLTRLREQAAAWAVNFTVCPQRGGA